MTRIVIELDADQQERLQRIAEAERRSPQELGREAVEQFLRSRAIPSSGPSSDPYAALRAMVGLVKGGPTEASIHHDRRPGEDE